MKKIAISLSVIAFAFTAILLVNTSGLYAFFVPDCWCFSDANQKCGNYCEGYGSYCVHYELLHAVCSDAWCTQRWKIECENFQSSQFSEDIFCYDCQDHFWEPDDDNGGGGET